MTALTRHPRAWTCVSVCWLAVCGSPTTHAQDAAPLILWNISDNEDAPLTRAPPMHATVPRALLGPGACLLLSLCALLFCAGVFGNVSVLTLVAHAHALRDATHGLLAGLAAADLLLLLGALPPVVVHALTGTWPLGGLTCKVMPYVEVTFLSVSSFSLCALVMDRVRAALQAPGCSGPDPRCGAALQPVIVWAGSLLLALPELLIWQLEDGPEPRAPPRCVQQVSVALPERLYVLGLTYGGLRAWWSFGLFFLLPVLVALGGSAAAAAAAADRRGGPRQRRLLLAVGALTLLHATCLLPHCVEGALRGLPGAPAFTLEALLLLGRLLLWARAVAGPLLLLHLWPPLSSTFLRCCCCCCRQGAPQHTGTLC